jgi:hypothetical protein
VPEIPPSLKRLPCLAILRKVAINLISHGRTAQISMRARRKQAAWNDEYMLSLLAG